MVEFTLLEVHFDEANLTAHAPFSHAKKSDRPEDEQSAAERTSRTGTLFSFLVGLAFSIVVAYLIRKKVFADSADESDMTFTTDEE